MTLPIAQGELVSFRDPDSTNIYVGRVQLLVGNDQIALVRYLIEDNYWTERIHIDHLSRPSIEDKHEFYEKSKAINRRKADTGK